MERIYTSYPFLTCPDFQQNAVLLRQFPLPTEFIKNAILNQNWIQLDHLFKQLTAPTGELTYFLKTFLQFQTIEFILAIRQAPDDEDGIWHDDGSRLLGFSLSLNFEPQAITGGELLFRLKGEIPPFLELKTQSFGTIALFKTGLFHVEHKVTQVTKGTRIVIAGWCS